MPNVVGAMNVSVVVSAKSIDCNWSGVLPPWFDTVKRKSQCSPAALLGMATWLGWVTAHEPSAGGFRTSTAVTVSVGGVAFTLLGWSIPKHVEVMHLCDRPAGIRLEHLALGTKGDNKRDMAAKGRGRNASVPKADDDPCPAGHVRNFRRGPDGWRQCRDCNREAQRRYEQRRRDRSERVASGSP